MSAAHHELLALSAVELRRLIACRELSPVALVDACIARIEAVNPAVNAIAATDFERARGAARALEGGEREVERRRVRAAPEVERDQADAASGEQLALGHRSVQRRITWTAPRVPWDTRPVGDVFASNSSVISRTPSTTTGWPRRSAGQCDRSRQ